MAVPATPLPSRRRLRAAARRRPCSRRIRRVASSCLARGNGDIDTAGGYEGATERRRLQCTFTCDVCGERSSRFINPRAWERGTVFVQCRQCDAWHQLRDNLNLIDEVRFVDDDDDNRHQATQ